MPEPASTEIRWLIVRAIEEGDSPAEAGAEYGKSQRSAERYHLLYKKTGNVDPKPMGGDRRSQKIEVYHDDIIDIVEEKPDRTLAEILKNLVRKKGKDAEFSLSTVWRFLDRACYSLKTKAGHAAEQSSPKIERQRGNFYRRYDESVRVISIDETGVSTNMTRSKGRCKRDKRLEMALPHGHRLNVTCVAAVSEDEIMSRWAFAGPMNTKRFVKWIREDLAKKLKKGDILLMDNLSVHKTKAVQAAIEKTGAKVLFLPPYSPDFNPIEKVFSKLKALLRRAEKRTVRSLKREVKKILDSITPEECAAYFRYSINEMKKVQRDFRKKVNESKNDN